LIYVIGMRCRGLVFKVIKKITVSTVIYVIFLIYMICQGLGFV
jgi:hypothetical protein